MINTKTTLDTNQASSWLKQGYLLAYPTESVWGLGCDAYNEAAVNKILAIKKRSIDKGLIVVTDDVTRLEPLIKRLTIVQQHRIMQSWQGDTEPLNTHFYGAHSHSEVSRAQTWLLPLTDKPTIPKWITGKHNSIAVRVIHHPLIKKLCLNMVSDDNPYGFIVSTSCNVAGQPPATSFDEAYCYFGNTNQMTYLQGETLGYIAPSQIKDAVTGQVVR